MIGKHYPARQDAAAPRGGDSVCPCRWLRTTPLHLYVFHVTLGTRKDERRSINVLCESNSGKSHQQQCAIVVESPLEHSTLRTALLRTTPAPTPNLGNNPGVFAKGGLDCRTAICTF